MFRLRSGITVVGLITFSAIGALLLITAVQFLGRTSNKADGNAVDNAIKNVLANDKACSLTAARLNLSTVNVDQIASVYDASGTLLFGQGSRFDDVEVRQLKARVSLAGMGSFLVELRARVSKTGEREERAERETRYFFNVDSAGGVVTRCLPANR